MMKRAILGLLLAFLAGAQAFGQSFPQTMPPSTVYGRTGIGSGPGQAIPFSTLFSLLTTGSKTFPGDLFLGSGRPWCDVRAKGAKGDGSTDDTVAFQACVTTVEAFASSGTIYIPASANQYCIKSGPVALNMPYTRIVFETRNVQMSSCGSGGSVLRMKAGNQELHGGYLVGPGGGDGETTFGASVSTLILDNNCVFCVLEHTQVSGGLHAVQWNSGFAYAYDVIANNAYGSSIIYFGASAGQVAAGFLHSIIPDQTEYPAGIPPAGTTFAAWQATHAYTTGTVVSTQCQDGRFYFFQATTGGTSGGSFPNCKNYGQNINDGTVVWTLSRPNEYFHYQMDSYTSEVFLMNSDTGGGDAGVAMTDTANVGGSAPGLFRGVNLNGGGGYIANFWGRSGTDFQIVNANTNGCISPGCGNYFFQSAFTGNVKITGGNCGSSPYCILMSSGSNYNVTGITGLSLTSGIANITNAVDNVHIDGIFSGVTTFGNTSSGTNIVVQNANKPWTLANGGTNNKITAVNGGVVWSDASKLNISALLTQNALMLGGGAGAAPATLGSLGTTTTLLHGNAGGAPTFGQVANADMVNTGTTVAGQTCTLGSTCGLATANNVLGADVTLNNTANYFDGPSMAQGTTGTWWVSGTATVSGNASDIIRCKLWDGTTVIASTQFQIAGSAPEGLAALSGLLASPAANIRISCRNTTSTTASKIIFNDSANSKDSTISGVRIN